MELVVDQEFKDLIPPLTDEEYKGLEEDLLENGFKPGFPIVVWKGQGIIVDGHNRYGICQKHKIPFKTLEQEFESRYDVIKCMLDIQLHRRSPNKKKRTYVIGRRYLVEKQAEGDNQYTNDSLRRVSQNGTASVRTDQKIGDQLGIGRNTVNRAAEFTLAVDKIVSVTGIKVNDLLDDRIKGTMEEINKLAEMEEEAQQRIIDLILNYGELSISLASNRLDDEERDRLFKEAEEKRKQMTEELRVKREVNEANERELLRIAHEARVKQENERLAKEREEQEKRRLAEIERQKTVAEEKARNEAERERIRKEKEELERVEMAHIAEHFKRLQELKQKKLEEQKSVEEEKIKQVSVAKEKIDKETVEKVKADIPVTPYDPYITCARVIMGEITLNACKKSGTKYVIGASEEYHDDNTLNQSWSGKVWLDILGAKSDSKCYVDKVIKGYLDGKITNAFVIARNDTGAEWFKQIASKANAIVFPVNGELKNYALIYFGNNAEVFMSECVKFGWGSTLNK